MWDNILIEFLQHRGKIIGLLIGLLFALMVINYGFWRTVFIVFCLYFGFVIGKRIDEHESLKSIFGKILRDQ